MIDCTLDEVVCWIAACVLGVGLLYASEDCQRYTEGTDMYWECVTGEEIDLGIQDEADTVTSQEREGVTQ